MNRMESLLYDEIQAELENMKEEEMDPEVYKTTVDGLTKLMDRAIEIEKTKNDNARRIEENEFKRQQLRDENKDRLIRNILTGAGIAIPTIVTIWGTLKSLKFEETGTVTTIMGRGFINKLLPRK